MYLNIASTINPNMHTYCITMVSSSLLPSGWGKREKRRIGRDQCSALGYVLVELFNLGTLETQNCCILSFYITLHYNTLLTWKPGSLEPANLRELLALEPWEPCNLRTLNIETLGPCNPEAVQPWWTLYRIVPWNSGGTWEIAKPWNTRKLGASNPPWPHRTEYNPGTIVTGPEPPGTSVGVGVTHCGQTTAHTCKHRVLNSNASTLFTLLAVFWFLFYGSRWMGNTASSHDNSLFLFAIFESWLNSFGCAFCIHKRPCHRRLIFGACLTRLLTFHL